MAFFDHPALPDVSHDIHSTRHFSWTAGFPHISRFDSHDGLQRLYGINSGSRPGGFGNFNALTTLNDINTQCTTLDKLTTPQTQTLSPETHIKHLEEPPRGYSDSGGIKSQRPFHRWMRSLHKRVNHGDYGEEGWPAKAGWKHLESKGTHRRSLRRRLSRRLSSSGSSLGLIAAVQSASISIASASAISRSRKNHCHSHGRSRTERSSRASLSAPRFSEDSVPLEKVKMDGAAIHRSLRRRQILEELISTEESYIGDIRFLMHTYINMLAALPTLPERLRSSINHNLDQILQLHEEILGELHRAVPYSEYSQADYPAVSFKPAIHKVGNCRLSSLDILPEDSTSLQWLEKELGMFSEPQVAAETAKIFSKRMHQFFMYKEYGAKYEIMIKDATSTLENLPEWEIHQKGLEAFAFTMDSSPSGNDRKSLTIGDLLVKRLDANSKNQVRSFGHIKLCGVLHVCWQTPTGVDGQYMICLLYKDVFCLASGGKFDPIYTVLACIDIRNATVEDTDNRRGLQCHLAPFSWKLVFESDHQLYELVMTACTSKEESEWRSRLNQPRSQELDAKTPGLQIFLSLDIQSLGTVFGRPGTIARSLSAHQTSIGGPESSLCHVILKNTSAMRPGTGASTGNGLNRSQSLLSTKTRTPVLVPSRSERARLEVLLANVWSQDLLPLPSRTNVARNEQIIKRSASMMMRKLSVSSIARKSESLTRRVIEDRSSEDQARHTSLSSDGGFDIFDRVSREESSQSYTTKSSISPETRDLGEESYISDTMTPKLELAQILELEPLGLMGVLPDKQPSRTFRDVTALQESTTNKLQASSSQTSPKTEAHSLAKESLSSCADVAVRDKEATWVKCKDTKVQRKHTNIRRFFRG
ncbi:hypothetical protein FHETE_9290 [Fusarium heterosporum]|uniref:DH domain-containing protein n=1 Tax=Fusarium heterosporum TaxID=42747 RepID=A0A8H5SYU9_FUSHE|nr:hypothetical protein FHETE_9290 [Fusarium heterosporum]